MSKTLEHYPRLLAALLTAGCTTPMPMPDAADAGRHFVPWRWRRGGGGGY